MPGWLVALITAAFSAVAALLGALIGGRMTLRAARESFDRARDTERDTWRRALHRECLFNIRLWHEDPNGTWEFETRVLDEIVLHAGALKPTELERVLWIKVGNAKVAAALARWRELREGGDSSGVSSFNRPLGKVHVNQLREPVAKEIMDLEASLRA